VSSADHVARLRRARREPLFAALPRTLDWGRPVLHRLLPHREPLLLLDRIVAADDHRLVAERTLDPADPVFAGHFPGDPVYPGALLLEMGGQLGLCLGQSPAEVPRPVRLIRVHGAEFVAAARPGDHLTVLAERIEDDGWTVLVIAQVLCGESVVCAAVLEAIAGDIQ
jgi:3-hydroxymyristoyl/3-hydroxydecanoyl-(acyl carrier protein) dehydratase